MKLRILSFLEFPVGSVGFSEQYVTLASYVTCWILLPALCLIRVGEVGTKQERKDKVSMASSYHLPHEWTRIPKQIGCTFKCFINSDKPATNNQSSLTPTSIWLGKRLPFCFRKSLEEKTWPWYHFCIPFFEVGSLLHLCLLSDILYCCHHHSIERLTLHQAFSPHPPPIPNPPHPGQSRFNISRLGVLIWGGLSPLKWNGVNRSAAVESNSKLQKTSDASCLTASTRSTPIKVRTKGELNSS